LSIVGRSRSTWMAAGQVGTAPAAQAAAAEVHDEHATPRSRGNEKGSAGAPGPAPLARGDHQPAASSASRRGRPLDRGQGRCAADLGQGSAGCRAQQCQHLAWRDVAAETARSQGQVVMSKRKKQNRPDFCLTST